MNLGVRKFRKVHTLLGRINKSMHWKYEEEVRLIRHESGLTNIPPDAIREVIVGKRVSESDKDSVLQVLDKESLSHIRFGLSEYKDNSFEMNVKWADQSHCARN